MAIYGYARVSTQWQTNGNSLEEQRELLLEKGVPKDKIIEEAYTGKTKHRPKFDWLVKKLKDGDTLVVTKLDRFCRSTEEGLEVIKQLQEKNVSIHILNMGLIENTPIGKLIITNLLAFAEFERAMILERTQSGKAIARQREDFKDGRPRKFNNKKVEEALNAIEGGMSYTQAEEVYSISKSTLTRRMRERKAKQILTKSE